MQRSSPRLISTLAVVLSLGVAGAASALPVGNPGEQPAAAERAPTWEELDASGVDYTAIVALSNCSGSLVRFTTSNTTDAAMVLTNGHCIGRFITANDAVVGEASSRTFTLLGGAFAFPLGTLRANQLVYGTMTNTDFAIYRLTQSYAQIAKSFHIAPLTISDHHASTGASIRVVSGFWRKIYSCTISKFVYQLREGMWTFRDSIRYTEPGCETIGGTSGSPIIQADTKEIIGINNTGNEDGASCTLNNPCEVDEHGAITFEKGASYGQELYGIYTCLNAANEIDLNRTGCVLNKPL